MNVKFKNLVLIIFNQTFGILPYHNERTELFQTLFPSYQLGRDIKKIEQNEPLSNPSIYVAAINEFFSGKQDVCIEKTTQLIDLLISNGYLNNLENLDIISKCDQSTLSIYHNLILDIWDYYYTQYSSDKQTSPEKYSISQNILDSIIQKYTEVRLPVILEFYKQRIPDIVKLLRINKPDSLFTNIETEYVLFFKNVLENNSFYTLSSEDQKQFINALYAISDILNRMHHEDSYRIDLEILTFLNNIYHDNYSEICIDDIRRIQGCLYAISIDKPETSLRGNLKLTSHNNLTKAETDNKSFSMEDKLQMCDKALRSLLTNKFIKKLDQSFEHSDYITVYENRLERNRNFTPEEINELIVLSLIYSNIACCALQYIKSKINTSKYNEYVGICEVYHGRSRYIRNLIIRITKKMHGEDSTEYKDALHYLATYYHSVATRYYYMKKYADSIAIRSVLHTFYNTLGLKEKVHVQLELAPINEYEKNGGNALLYEKTTKNFFEKYREDFSYLFSEENLSYEEFKRLADEYQIYKKFL